MGSRFMDYPSPRGVHVPETYANTDDDDPYRRTSVHSARRNRYSRSVHQTPRLRDVTWVSPPDPTPQSLHAPSTPWMPVPQVPSSPAHRPRTPVAAPPSPVPTVGEHMTVDDVLFADEAILDSYVHQPQRQSGSFIRSFWRGLKKLSGFQATPRIPRISSYGSQTMEMPVPELSVRSEATQYVNPTPPETDEQHGMMPYTSPYSRPKSVGATPAVIPSSLRASPAILPGSIRASPAPVPHLEPPPITVVAPSTSSSSSSPSIPRTPRRSSIRSRRMPSPARMPEPLAPPMEDGSQTLHEHEPFPRPIRAPLLPALIAPDVLRFPTPSGGFALDSPSPSKGSLASTVARMRRFIAELDDLPWVAQNQIADEYVPERTPRSQMRKRVRQGADPSWYNERPEAMDRPEVWSEWDTWAKQSAAALLDGPGGNGRAVGWGGAGASVGAGVGAPGPWGVMYPHGGYVPAMLPPGFVYPSGYPPPGMVDGPVHMPVP